MKRFLILIRLVLLLVVATSVIGCAGVTERHYFGAFESPTPSNPTGLVNVFRVNIDANGGWSSMRYIAGVYDERAVEFFLNEAKSQTYTPGSGTTAGLPKIFDLSCKGSDGKAMTPEDCRQAHEKKLTLGSLATGMQQAGGSFVIILSTNADAISETIGSIAESDIMIKSVNYLLNKETIDKAAGITAIKSDVEANRKVAFKTLGSVMGTAYKANQSKAVSDELLILNLIAGELEPDKTVLFTEIEEAKKWILSIN